MAITSVQTIINGQTYNLNFNEKTQQYEATVTAPNKSSYNQEGHFYGVTVKATDDAGNTTTVDHNDSTLGDSLKLYVKEKVAPVMAFTYPTAGALITNSKPTIEFDVTDLDSGVNPETIKITIDSQSAITDGIEKTMITNGYHCKYTPINPLGEGSHTVKIDSADFDENQATQKSVTFKVDTVPPILNLTSPENDMVTNKNIVVVAGTTNDATSSPVTLTVNDKPVTVNENGSFSYNLTLNEGVNNIVVKATDSAGKVTTVTRTVTLDTGAPVFKSVTITPNPVDNGATFIISVKVDD